MRDVSRKTADKFIVSSPKKSYCNISPNTTIYYESYGRYINLFGSTIISYDSNRSTLSYTMAGYDTVTTRARINEVMLNLHLAGVLPHAWGIACRRGKRYISQGGFPRTKMQASDTIVIKNVYTLQGENRNAQLALTLENTSWEVPQFNATFKQLAGVL